MTVTPRRPPVLSLRHSLRNPRGRRGRRAVGKFTTILEQVAVVSFLYKVALNLTGLSCVATEACALAGALVAETTVTALLIFFVGTI